MANLDSCHVRIRKVTKVLNNEEWKASQSFNVLRRATWFRSSPLWSLPSAMTASPSLQLGPLSTRSNSHHPLSGQKCTSSHSAAETVRDKEEPRQSWFFPSGELTWGQLKTSKTSRVNQVIAGCNKHRKERSTGLRQKTEGVSSKEMAFRFRPKATLLCLWTVGSSIAGRGTSLGRGPTWKKLEGWGLLLQPGESPTLQPWPHTAAWEPFPLLSHIDWHLHQLLIVLKMKSKILNVAIRAPEIGFLPPWPLTSHCLSPFCPSRPGSSLCPLLSISRSQTFLTIRALLMLFPAPCEFPHLFSPGCLIKALPNLW